jgi:hypothetical protein
MLIVGALILSGCGDDVGETGPAAATEATVESTAPDGTGSEGEPDGGEPAHNNGHGKPEEPISAEGQIMNATGAFLASPESDEVCGDLVTENLLQQSYGDLQGCLQGRPKPTLAKRSRLELPDIDGSSATIVATPEGGLYDGVEVEFTFVLEGDTWLIDSVSADIPVGP